MKPNSWKSCPFAVLERFLENVKLDYDPWESSKDEAVASFAWGSQSHRNEETVKEEWSELTEERFQLYLKQTIETLQNQLDQCKELV